MASTCLNVPLIIAAALPLFYFILSQHSLSRRSSRLWRHAGSGQSGRDPAAAAPLPSRRSPPSLPLLFGNWPFTARATGASAVVSERQGGTTGSTAVQTQKLTKFNNTYMSVPHGVVVSAHKFSSTS